jgi:hypothetical protein
VYIISTIIIINVVNIDVIKNVDPIPAEIYVIVLGSLKFIYFFFVFLLVRIELGLFHQLKVIIIKIYLIK